MVLLVIPLAGCLGVGSDASQGVGLPPNLTCGPCDVVLESAGSAFEPSGAVNPLDGDHYVMALKSGDAGFTVHVTHDGGRSWQQHKVPLGDYSHMGDPVVTFGPDGTLYVAGLGHRLTYATNAVLYRPGSDIVYLSSADGGATFDGPFVVAAGSGHRVAVDAVPPATGDAGAMYDYTTLDREWLAVDQHRIVAIWNALGTRSTLVEAQNSDVLGQWNGNRVHLATSFDGGITWQEKIYDWNGGVQVVAVDDGFVAAVSEFAGDLHLGRSSDGLEWSWVQLGRGYGQPDITAWSGGLAVATNVYVDDGLAPAYWIYDSAWSGPYVVQGPGEMPHTNIAGRGDELWLSWYATDGDTYDLARIEPLQSPWPAQRFTVAQGVQSTTGAYGHYVDTLAVSDRVYVAWNQQDGQRQIHAAVYA